MSLLVDVALARHHRFGHILLASSVRVRTLLLFILGDGPGASTVLLCFTADNRSIRQTSTSE